MMNKRIYLCLIIFLCLFTCCFVVKPVHASVSTSYAVTAYLGEGLEWADGGTEDSRSGWYDSSYGKFGRYFDNHGEPMDNDYFDVVALDGYTFEEYSIAEYNGGKVVMSWRGSSLINSQWQNQLSGNYNNTLVIDSYAYSTDITLKFIYWIDVIYDNDGSIIDYTTTTDTLTIRRFTTIAQNNKSAPVPQDFEYDYFSYWRDNNGLGIIQDDINNKSYSGDKTFTAIYTKSTYSVTFKFGSQLLGTEIYDKGVGTIEPPDYSFGVNQTLQGWSLTPNGSVIDLSRYNLTNNITLYAILTENEIPNNREAYTVTAYLGTGLQWADGGTELVRTGWYSEIYGKFGKYFDQHGEPVVNDYFNVVAKSGYTFNEYSIAEYSGDELVMSWRGSSLIDSQWQNQLSGDYDNTLKINSYAHTTNITLKFEYRIGIEYNPDGSFANYIYDTTYMSIRKFSTISQNNKSAPTPLNYGGEYFVYWISDNVKYLPEDINNTSFSGNKTFTAVYAKSTYLVTFNVGYQQLGTYRYESGIGTIQPPKFTFNISQSLLGWSTQIDGDVLDFSKYELTEDTTLYAILTTRDDYNNSFDLEYTDCSVWDIPCHLGNAFIFFLTEFPIVKDIVAFFVPIGDLISLFVQNIAVFEVLGTIFYIALGILLISFIFRFLR